MCLRIMRFDLGDWYIDTDVTDRDAGDYSEIDTVPEQELEKCRGRALTTDRGCTS